MAAIRAICRTEFHAARSSGTRPLSGVKWVVIHDTEGGSARSIARYFASDQAQGSAHLVVDDLDCYRCLKNTEVPWGAPGANSKGFHIEQCGFAKWTDAEWKKHLRTLERAAFKTALHCRLFKIPAVFVEASGLKVGAAGVTTHAECSKAFGGDHTDPGRNWPRALFMHLVRGYLVGLEA